MAPFTQISHAAPGWAKFLIREDFENPRKVGHITEPLFLLHGKNDRVVPFNHSQRLFDISRANTTLIGISNAGHRPAPKPLVDLTVLAIEATLSGNRSQLTNYVDRHPTLSIQYKAIN